MLLACVRSEAAEPMRLAHPDRTSATIEYFVEQPAGSGPWPTVVFLHGHQNGLTTPGGRAFSDWGVLQRYAAKGYLAVSISLPGYGGSTGPADFAGPDTQGAVAAVLDHIGAIGQADPRKIVIEGISLGAVTAGLVGASDLDIAGLVLISGLYDLPAYLGKPTTDGAKDVKAAAVRQTGGSADALAARSVLPRAAQIRAPTLILNGALDDRTDPDQAVRLGAAINAAGGRARTIIYPQSGHQIPVEAREAEISAFIAQVAQAGTPSGAR